MFTLIWEFIKFGIMIIGFYCAIHAIITHFILWYDARLKTLQGIDSYKPCIWDLMRGAALEALCNFFRICLIPFSRMTFPPSISSTHPKLPIILVHGYSHHQTDWLWFKWQLEQQNVGPIYTLNLFPRDVSIKNLGEKLKQKIQEIQTETQAASLVLIGHSMGGLVCSYYAENLAKPGAVKAIITLGTPFAGTQLAALSQNQNALEMFPESDFLQSLRDKIENSDQDYYCIASRLDNLIIPWQSALLTNPNNVENTLDAEKNNDNEMILDNYNHLRLLISPRVVQKVGYWIKALSQQ